MNSNNKRINFRDDVNYSSKKKKISAVWIDLIQLGHKFDDSISGFESLSSMLEPDKPYTIGRSNRVAHFIFNDSRVSKQHCQILFDSLVKKLYLFNGVFSSSTCNCSNRSNCCIVNQFRDRLIVKDNHIMERTNFCFCSCTYSFKASLNGVIVNGVKINEGMAVELGVGDEVMLICGNTVGVCGGLNSWIGFMVRRVVFQEELVTPGFNELQIERPRVFRPLLPGKVNKRVFAALRVRDMKSLRLGCDEVVRRAKSLSARCNQIVRSDDPVSYIRRCIDSCSSVGGLFDCSIEGIRFQGIEPNSNTKTTTRSVSNMAVVKQQPFETFDVEDIRGLRDTMVQPNGNTAKRSVSNEAVVKQQPFETFDVEDIRGLRDTVVQPNANAAVFSEKIVSSVLKAPISYPNGCSGNTANSSDPIFMDGRNSSPCEAMRKSECQEKIPSPPGKNFYLNDLNCMPQGSSRQNKVVSLPELLHPVNSILRIFIGTFTSDIEWFLSYCDIPSHLPVTVACHNSERCWSGDPCKRSCVPNPNFPYLVLVYPPFPEAIAFGKDRKNRGVGCHHPKLLVLQREDSMRVIITSANLVAKQWQSVTNTIWWQDFPIKKIPDCKSLFNQLNRSVDNDFRSDFAAQLAGFMATLVNDVPSEAHWIIELTKYDFSQANGYLVASIPGIHSYRSLSATSPACKSNCSEMLLGSVEASVVGLSHLFRTAVDSNGIQLRKLASYLGKSSVFGVSEIVLRREKNIPADPNAVSVVVLNPTEISKGDCVQLGFLPRAVAKWVSPLWDAGFFRFCGHLCPKEALAAAFGENNLKVQLILHVSQGPNFLDLPKTMIPEHAVSFCSLVASLQRCTGLRRMEEVLHQYKWPEPLESDFIYGSSSIGTSVSAQFLAAFSAAAGKRSQHLYDSEESDPEWGRWNATDELKNPSIRVIFPTIDRVKNAHCGILPSKHLLCFSEKTWQRLKMVNILHDAIPQPDERVGYPMHVKVARRRFKSKKDGSSFGWIYCGSHNMSAAAWGRPISIPSGNLVSGRSEEQSSVSSLHVCNYELGIIFVFPPPETKVSSKDNSPNLDDIYLPFVEPAPRYGPRDRPATKRAMSEALTELAKEGRALDLAAAVEEGVEEVPGEDDEVEAVSCLVPEKEEEKAYAEFLWHQVDSSQSC